MSEQLELFIGHPPGDEPGKTKIADATASSSWNVNFNNGNVNTNNRQNANRVRPLAATGNIIYDILLSSIFEASEDCARQKRTSTDCVEFYNDYQSALVRLWYSIIYGEYVPDFSKVFIRTYPVYREVLPPLSLIVLSITGSLFVSSRF